MGAYAREEIEAIYRRQFKLVYQICPVPVKSVPGCRPDGLSPGAGAGRALS